MMRILFFAAYVPYPLDSGGKIRTYNLVRGLARHHDVTLVCLSGTEFDDFGPLRQCCKEVISVKRPARVLTDLCTFMMGSYPFNFVRFGSEVMTQTLKDVLQRTKFDMVHVDSTLLWQYAPLFSGLPLALGSHNVEYEIVAQLKDASRNVLKNALYALEKKKLTVQEQRAWRECDICLTVSERERDVIAQTLNSRGKIVAAPNGVDLERFPYQLKEACQNRLLFLGGMDYLPNLDSAKFFLTAILPLIEARQPSVTVDFVGRGLDRIRHISQSKAVSFHENVPDVLEWFRQADVLVVPLRLGAGTRLKVLEAMGAGVPIVTTSKGSEGIDVAHQRDVLIADDAHVFCEEVVRLLNDRALRETLARNARRIAEEKYSWTSIANTVEQAYLQLVQKAS